MQSIASNRGLSAKPLEPTSRLSGSVQQRRWAAAPGRHSAAACSGEIRQSPTDTAGILSQTRGDRLQEIFWRVATRGPEPDFCRLLLCRPGGDGSGASGKFLCCRKGKRKKPSCLLPARCRGCKAQGANPWRRQAASPAPAEGVLLGWGWKRATDTGAGERCPLCSLLNITAPPRLHTSCLPPGSLSFCQHHDSPFAAVGLRDEDTSIPKAHSKSRKPVLRYDKTHPAPASLDAAQLPFAPWALQGQQQGRHLAKEGLGI